LDLSSQSSTKWSTQSSATAATSRELSVSCVRVPSTPPRASCKLSQNKKGCRSTGSDGSTFKRIADMVASGQASSRLTNSRSEQILLVHGGEAPEKPRLGARWQSSYAGHSQFHRQQMESCSLPSRGLQTLPRVHRQLKKQAPPKCFTSVGHFYSFSVVLLFIN